MAWCKAARLLGIAALLAAGCDKGRSAFVERVKGKPAPDFELTDLEGKTVRLSSLHGKPVVLAFFAVG